MCPNIAVLQRRSEARKLHRCWLWEYEIFKPSAHVTHLYDKSRQGAATAFMAPLNSFPCASDLPEASCTSHDYMTPSLVKQFPQFRKVTRIYDTCHVLLVETDLTRAILALSQWNSQPPSVCIITCWHCCYVLPSPCKSPYKTCTDLPVSNQFQCC